MFVESDVCPQAGDTILDLGCGTGELSAYLAELVGTEGKVVARPTLGAKVAVT